MPIDPRLIVQGIQTSFPESYTTPTHAQPTEQQKQMSAEELKQKQQQSEENALKIEAQKIKNLDSREQARFKSSVIGAAHLNTYLENDDITGAESFLNQRRTNLQRRIAAGEDIDTTETDDALRLLKEDPEQLKKTINSAIKLGQLTGDLQAPKEAGVGGATGELINRLQADAKAQGKELSTSDALAQIQTGYRQGVTFNEGVATPIPGLGQAKGDIARQEEYGKKTGGLEAELGLAPAVEQAKEEAKVRGGVLPEKIQLKQDELIDDIALNTTINANLGEFTRQIDTGELDLNAVANIQNKIKNNLSVSTEESRNLESFKATLNKLRNDSLRLNKGVQTEGDAQRAMDELINNISDPKVVRQRLTEIRSLNKQAAEIKQLRLQLLRKENRKPEIDLSEITSTAGQPSVGRSSQQNTSSQIEFLGFE